MRLFYVADPMCSWCWGFAPVLAAAEARLRRELRPRLVLGGLAPDDEAPMPEATKRYVRSAWRAVEERTGVAFDHSFWEKRAPRRSTWPACRAVLAAGDRGRPMFDAIQRAYYLETRDPSDRATLVALAVELGLEEAGFEAALDAPETKEKLAQDFELRDRLGVNGFPSLALDRDGEPTVLTRGWVDSETLERTLAEHGLLATA